MGIPQLQPFCWASLLGHEPGRYTITPCPAAARAKDLTGPPPALISIGALGLLVDESLA
ncbi:hypothetical protein ACFPFX_33335 [Streptomyces mauvecolor]|uniref:Uncharacterized protein n=1 Tax=Streptomyces mauvecolor TaxID=58345 RepID=A0ABV9UVG8_9ACTN